MKDPAAKQTRILGVDKDGAFLPHIRGMIEERCPGCILDIVPGPDVAIRRVRQTPYDLLIVDTDDDSDCTLLDLASARSLPVLAVFSRQTRPETIRYFCTPSVRAFISRNGHEAAVQAIERILSEACTPWWKHTIRKLLGGVADSQPSVKWQEPSSLYRSDVEIYGMLRGDLYVCH
jgi:hypothetical protein